MEYILSSKSYAKEQVSNKLNSNKVQHLQLTINQVKIPQEEHSYERENVVSNVILNDIEERDARLLKKNVIEYKNIRIYIT